MRSNNHCFTRDGITYDCYAYNRSSSRIPGDNRRRWHITALGKEVPAFEFEGSELSNKESIRAFEERVTQFIGSHNSSETAQTSVLNSDSRPGAVPPGRDAGGY